MGVNDFTHLTFEQIGKKYCMTVDINRIKENALLLNRTKKSPIKVVNSRVKAFTSNQVDWASMGYVSPVANQGKYSHI